MANENTEPRSEAATVRESAPATETPVAPQPKWTMPHEMKLGRATSSGAPQTHFFPEVRGGVCEYCGVIDENYPSEYQYKLCPHYRGMQLRCRYCPESKDPDDVINHSRLQVAEHPYHPGELMAWCDSYECTKKFHEEFDRGART